MSPLSVAVVLVRTPPHRSGPVDETRNPRVPQVARIVGRVGAGQHRAYDVGWLAGNQLVAPRHGLDDVLVPWHIQRVHNQASSALERFRRRNLDLVLQLGVFQHQRVQRAANVGHYRLHGLAGDEVDIHPTAQSMGQQSPPYLCDNDLLRRNHNFVLGVHAIEHFVVHFQTQAMHICDLIRPAFKNKPVVFAHVG